MNVLELEGKQSFLQTALVASANGSVYTAGFDRQAANFQEGRYESGYFLVTLAAGHTATALELCVQHSDTDGSYADANFDDLQANSMKRVVETVTAGQTYQYHINVAALKRFFRLRVTSDAAGTIDVKFVRYGARKYPVPEGDSSL